MDSACLSPTGSPDFLAEFLAVAFGMRQSLFRAGRSHQLMCARLRTRLDDLVERERVRISTELLSLDPRTAEASLLAQRFRVLSPVQRVGICLCFSCGGGPCSRCVRPEVSTPSPSTRRRRASAAPVGG